jgi:hypothetical protein
LRQGFGGEAKEGQGQEEGDGVEVGIGIAFGRRIGAEW